MSVISIRGLRKTFGSNGDVVAIDDLDLDVAEGELLILLGPSGCGKTTTLRSIAGLEAPDAGSIRVGEQLVHDSARGISLPPARRNLGMVFQSYALWPHKTVRQNIEYPIRARRIKQGIAEDWAAQTASLVDCSELLDRYPSQLSGGQQQRVALARGLAGRPSVMLFDEPMSNLDAKLREQVRGELHALHGRLNFTGVYVTHDQVEAMALGDRVAIMRTGRIEQLGSPEEVFASPKTDYVADFVGYQNRISVSRRRGEPAPHYRLRPEDLLLKDVNEDITGMVALGVGKVVDVIFAGRAVDIYISRGDELLKAHVPMQRMDRQHLQVGSTVALAGRPDDVRSYDSESGEIASIAISANDLSAPMREL